MSTSDSDHSRADTEGAKRFLSRSSEEGKRERKDALGRMGAAMGKILAQPTRWKFCPECGEKLKDGWAYCAKCGMEIGVKQVTSSEVHHYHHSPMPNVWASDLNYGGMKQVTSSEVHHYHHSPMPNVWASDLNYGGMNAVNPDFLREQQGVATAQIQTEPHGYP